MLAVQAVRADPDLLPVTTGGAVEFGVMYSTEPATPNLTGLGLRMHFDSTKLTFNQLADVLANSLFQQGSPTADTANFDGDATTDQFISVAWADFVPPPNWPGEATARLYTAKFTAGASVATTQVNFTASSTASGSTFSGTPASIQIVSNRPPAAPTDSSTAPDIVLEGSVNGTLVGLVAQAADPDGQPVTYTLSDSAGGRFAIDDASGAVSVANGALLDFETAASHTITVQVSDGVGGVATQNFTIAVGNVAPIATDFPLAVSEGLATTLTLLAADPNGGALTYIIVVPPQFGTLSGTGANLTYTPNAGFAGADSFTYKANDGQADSNTATVSLTVAPLGSGQAVFGGGVLRVNGTAGDDTIVVTQQGGNVVVTLGGTPLTITGGPVPLASLVEIQAWGREGNDTITVQGLATLTMLDGGEGDDTIQGGDGRDVIYGGVGNDTLRGGLGLDKMYGQLGNDVMIGGADRDTMSGQGGHDWLDGEAGNDLLYGNGGNDRVYGREGKNRLYGHQGNDVLVGGPEKDRVVGAEGFDILIAGGGTDSVLGHSEEDLVIGGPTSYDNDDAALSALAAAWIENLPLADRIQRIGTTGFGPNNQYRLVADDTVLADAAIDDLAGNGQADWYFAEDADIVQKVAVDVLTRVG